jgi:hypothetical protein
MKMILSELERDVFQAVLGNYQDNEHGKGPEGIGEDLSAELSEVQAQFLMGAKGFFLGEIEVTITQLALMRRALGAYETDSSVEELHDLRKGANEAVTALCRRIDRALPERL